MELILVLDTNDIWIAAATEECQGRLLSSDDHFRYLPFIDLEVE